MTLVPLFRPCVGIDDTVVYMVYIPKFTHTQSLLSQCYVDMDDSEVMMNQKVLGEKDAPHRVTIQVRPEGSTEWMKNYTYPKDALTSLEVRLDVPPALEKQDVQFVVETSDGAKFVEPVMCEGRRSFARSYDDAVTLVLEGSTDSISLKAGWASGYEAVSLTPSFVMQMEQSEPDIPATKEL